MEKGKEKVLYFVAECSFNELEKVLNEYSKKGFIPINMGVNYKGEKADTVYMYLAVKK